TLGIYVFLHGTVLGIPTTLVKADFDDAQGITPGTVVRMAGVKIGEVKDVTLDPDTKRAVITMRIQRNHTPGPFDKITIATGGLLPAPYVEIIPGRRTAKAVRGAFHGTSPASIDQLLAQGQTLMASMNQLARAFHGVVGDPRFTRDLKSSVASMAVT